MNLKSMDNAELKKETTKALKTLNEIENQFVQVQNLVAAFEDESDRRNKVRQSPIPPERVGELLKKWETRAEDMQAAANAMSCDVAAKSSLLMQRDVLLGCITDLKKAWRG